MARTFLESGFGIGPHSGFVEVELYAVNGDVAIAVELRGEIAFVSDLDGVVRAASMQVRPEIAIVDGVVRDHNGIRAMGDVNHFPSCLCKGVAINGLKEDGGLEGGSIVVLNDRSRTGNLVLRMIFIELNVNDHGRVVVMTTARRGTGDGGRNGKPPESGLMVSGLSAGLGSVTRMGQGPTSTRSKRISSLPCAQNISQLSWPSF
jgi:hypothetical protein